MVPFTVIRVPGPSKHPQSIKFPHDSGDGLLKVEGFSFFTLNEGNIIVDKQ